jgi:transcriptional regulator with XRE-family HTH domain
MLAPFGHELRALRKQHHLTVAQLAARTGYSVPYLKKIESGERAPTDAVADACDTAMGTAPLLQALLSIERGDPMLRRALLSGGFAAALLAVDSTAALAQALAYATTPGGQDWDQTVDDFTRRHLLGPSPQFGTEIATQIKIAQHAAATGDQDAGRAAARLSLIYGLWLGDLGRLPSAHTLYTLAARIADATTRDPATRALVRARAANRGIYEGWTAARTSTTITQALALHPHDAAGLEAYAARVHLAALTGDLPTGREAVTQMRRIAERMPDPTGIQRTADFACYLECRLGSLTQATAAYEHAETTLARVPLWRVDARLSYASALTRAGDIRTGTAVALDAIRSQVVPVRVLGVCVADVLHHLPPGAGGGQIEELAQYATTGPHPWDTL